MSRLDRTHWFIVRVAAVLVGTVLGSVGIRLWAKAGDEHLWIET